MRTMRFWWMDNVLIPWENVLIATAISDRRRRWTMEGGFARMYPLQSPVRPGSEIRLHYSTAEKISRMYRHLEFRGVQADPR